jgi:hypothetical protein
MPKHMVGTFSVVTACAAALVLLTPVTGRAADVARSIPAAAGRAALALPDNAPALADLKFPNGFKPGLRISYHAGDSVVAGVSSQLKPVPGKNGQWFDPKTGQNYNVEDVKSSGGVGFVQVNVLATTADRVALDSRNFQIVDVQRGVAVSGGGAATVGNAASAGVYWVNPALLALASADGGPPQPAGVKVARVKYPLGGKEYNALDVTSEGGGGFDHSVYDLDSGLLLLRTGSAVAGDVQVIDPATGRTSPGKGSTAIYHMVLVGARQLDVPWGDQPAPDWVAKGRQLQYGGGYNLVTPQGPLPPLGVSKSVELGDVSANVAVARIGTRSELGNGLPAQTSTEDRCYGPAMFNPLWIAPKAIEGLQANKVLDQDPVTKFQTTFAGVQGNSACVVEQGPTEATQFFYDTRSGMLIGVRATRQQGQVGQVQTQLQLTGQR